MTNSLVGDHQVAVVDVYEGVLEGSDISRTHLNRFLVEGSEMSGTNLNGFLLKN